MRKIEKTKSDPANEYLRILRKMAKLMQAQKRIMTLNEVSDYTELSKSTIYKLTMRKAIPHYKSPQGKAIYFKRAEIDKWLTSIQVTSLNELISEFNEFGINY